MSTVFLKSTRALNSIKQIKAHVKYVGFRSRELNERGFFGKDYDKADYKQFIGQIEKHPALRHSKSIKVHKLIFSLRENDYKAYKRCGKDFKDLVRATLSEYENSHDVKLEWIANIHEAEGHPHCHVIIMGASSVKDASGRYRRIFFSKNDYAQMKLDFDLAHSRDAEYYDVERIDLDKTLCEIEQGFDRAYGVHEPFTDDIKFEYGKYSGIINIYAQKKRIKSEAISFDKNKNLNNKYFRYFTDKEINFIRDTASSIGLHKISVYEVNKEIVSRINMLKDLKRQIYDAHAYINDLNNLASTYNLREAALSKLQGMSFDDRLNNYTEYIQAVNDLNSCNTILNKFGVYSMKDIQDKISSFNLESVIYSINRNIEEVSSEIKKLEDINKILKTSYKTEILKIYPTDDFKHMSFDQYVSLKVLNEYHGTNLSVYQLRDRFADVEEKYNDIKDKLNEVIDNRNRLDNAAHILGSIERDIKRLYIIDSRKDFYGENYITERDKIVERIDYQKSVLNDLGVKDKDDLKKQILEHNSKSRYVHDLKERLFNIKPEYDALKSVNEGMQRSIEIEDRIQNRGFIDLARGFDQVMKNIAMDVKREQAKAEFQRHIDIERISKRNRKGRDR